MSPPTVQSPPMLLVLNFQGDCLPDCHLVAYSMEPARQCLQKVCAYLLIGLKTRVESCLWAHVHWRFPRQGACRSS